MIGSLNQKFSLQFPVKIFWGIVTLLVSGSAISQQSKDMIHISPRSCLIENANSPCEEEIEVNWQLSQSIDFCISTKTQKNIFCSNKRNSGSQVLLSNLDKTTTFIVSEKQSGEIMARIVVFVVTDNAQVQRRRYRHPWSIF